jgi:glucans biosynthesis protein
MRDSVNRRDVLKATIAVPLVARGAISHAEPAADPFDATSVRRIARELATKPFKASNEKLPDAFKNLDYDQYRAIRYKPDAALWRAEKLPFEVQFFHRGFFYKKPVEIFEVVNGRATKIPYRSEDFSFGTVKPPGNGVDLGFAGFRIHAPINRPDYYDEVCVFLGASYFRAVAKGQLYGLSARGLAINTGQASGEEFPQFKAFWLEKPVPKARFVVIHALLDSESATAAYKFSILPGETTVFDVEVAVYPRVELQNVGLAPMTSMFFFGPNDRIEVDDFRPEVHDSDGLGMLNGRGETLWRPLNNPRDLQISSFADVGPRGFGLIQRQRDFSDYQDLESNFEKRPSLWAEPIGDWGEGSVQLLEIPTKEEIHDNISAFWHPKAPLQAKGEYGFTYRLHWGQDRPVPPPVAKFSRSGVGLRGEKAKLFVLDLAGKNLKSVDPQTIKGVVTADKTEIRNIVTQPNPQTGGWRLSFEMLLKDKTPVELRASLMEKDALISEVWVYRWAP